MSGDLQPGEVCTTDISVRSLGITDLAAFFSGTGVETYNSAFDQSKSITYRLCDYDPSSSTAYPTCEMSSTAGVGFRVKKSDVSKCIATQCPTGMILSDGVCQNVGVIKNNKVNKKEFSQERPYDWMQIPNFHLGNNYASNSSITYGADGSVTSNVITSYAPCPAENVPQYHNDPVDGDTIGDEVDHIDKCVPKSQYFNKKYANSPEYCPITNIHRYTLQKADVMSNLRNIKSSNINPSVAFNNKYSDSEISSAADKIIALNANVVVPTLQLAPLDNYAQHACSTLETQDRVDFAYRQCSNLNALGTDTNSISHMFVNSGTATSTNIAMRMKESCNALFCTEGSTAYGGDPICFKPSDISSTEVPEPVEDPYDDKYLKPPEKVDAMHTILPNSMKIFVLLLILPFFLIFAWYTFKYGRRWMRRFYRHFIRPIVKILDILFCNLLKLVGMATYCDKENEYETANNLDDIVEGEWALGDIDEEIANQTKRLGKLKAQQA